MVRLGKTFGNLMVDLRATNEKLRPGRTASSARRPGSTATAADALLERCGGELKTALVAQLAGVSADEARERLRDGRTGGCGPAVGHERQHGRADANGTGRTSSSASTAAARARSRCSRRATARGWQVLGRGEAGPSNLQAVGHGRGAGGARRGRSTGAFAAAGRAARDRFGAACLGLAGAGRPEDQDVDPRVGRADAHWPRRVDGDRGRGAAARGRHAGRLGRGGRRRDRVDGVRPRRRTAATARAGGWGYLLGDEGSGYAIALAGLRAAARAADGRGAGDAAHRPPARRARADAARGTDRRSSTAAATGRRSRRSPRWCWRPPQPATRSRTRSSATPPRELAAAAAAAARSARISAPTFPVALAGGLLVVVARLPRAVPRRARRPRADGRPGRRSSPNRPKGPSDSRSTRLRVRCSAS